MPKSFKYRVYYEDTDLGGVVYYANYLKFFERARTDFLRSQGVVQTKIAEDHGVVFVVKNCQVKYLKPARMDDEIEVSVEVVELGKLSVKMRQEIKLQEQVLCQMDVDIVCVHKDSFRPKKIPEEIKFA